MKPFVRLSWINAAVLLCLLPHVAKSADSSPMWREYLRSIKKAAIHSPEYVVPLSQISKDHDWIKVITFTEQANPNTDEYFIWVSLPHDLWKACHNRYPAILAIQQILGLPPIENRQGREWKLVSFVAPRERIFRPCPSGPDIDAPSCSLGKISDDLDPVIAKFLLNQIWTSDQRSARNSTRKGSTEGYGYPFTGMGWTYNWSPSSANHIGISEFVIKNKTIVDNVVALDPESFCAGSDPSANR